MGQVKRRAPDRDIALRHVPRGARGRRVLDAILDAAHGLLAEGDYASLSTNRIAQRAGISVGSLYHYFGSKESVIAELAARLEAQGLDAAEARFLSVRDAPIVALIVGLAEILFTDEVGFRPARRTLLANVPPRWFEDASRAADRGARALIAHAVAYRSADLRGGDPELMACVSYHAIEGLTEVAVRQRPQLMEDPAFMHAVLKMTVGYFTESPASSAPSPRSEKPR